MIDQKRLDEIMARCAAATVGPWTIRRDFADRIDSIGTEGGRDAVTWFAEYADSAYLQVEETDAAFIAAARQDIPDLLVEVERLRSELQAKDGLIGSLRLQVEELEGRESS